MSWNGSGAGKAVEPPKVKKGGGISPAIVKGALGGLLVIVIALAVFTFFHSDEKQKVDVGKKSEAIKEVKPAPAKKTEAEEHPGMVKVRGKWYPEYDEKGGRIWVRSKDVTYHTPVVVTNSVNPRRRTKESLIFKQRADAEIAVLLNSEGMLFLGPYTYGKRFTEDFLKAIQTPIVIDPEDDEDTKLLKQAVDETRKDLKARYDKGEDIGKIMDDTRRDLHELSMYREELRKEVMKVALDKDLRGKDVQELVDAANTMLVDRGVKPLSAPALFKRRLNLEVNRINKGTKK